MDYQQIDILENKINMAVDLIMRLREENRQLKQDNHELQEKAEENDKALRLLQDEFQHLSAVHEEAENLQKHEDLLKAKVEAMLAKLEGIQLSA